jgi:broad specificity phosphatase PhoE
MSRVILVRHGETDWNQEEIFRGRIDVKLNTTGLRQAEETGKTLAGMSMAAVYTSPLSRAKITAGKIAQFQKVSVVDEEGFTDMHFGEWQGLPLREVRERFRAIYDVWKIEPHKVKFSGGESLKEVAERSRSTLMRLTEKHSEGTVCIVSHRVICKVMILNMLELPLSRFWNIRQDTCAINIFVYQDGMWTVERINDTCHLKSLEKERLSDF